MNLNVPVDVERLPEFRMLCAELMQLPSPKPGVPVEPVAVYVWLRLWVELAYLAQTTNRPGWMNGSGRRLFEQSLGLFGEDVDVGALLERAGIWSRCEDGWMCERFGKLNGHLAGDYKPRELKGAASSALERNKAHIAREAQQQAMLLGPELFKRRDGTVMTDAEVNRCMVVIKTLDNCLKAPARSKGGYTEGLIADAAEVATRPPEELREFYIWLSLRRDHPALPKTTEQVLARFEELLPESKER